MKAQDIQGAVKAVVLDVFESMYFMFPEPIGQDDPMPSFGDACFKARVAVKDGVSAFILHGSEPLVKDMAKTLLGTDQPAETELIDLFKETANVVAGNLITRLSLDSSVALDVPEAERVQPCAEKPCTDADAHEVVFNIDDRLFKVTVVSSKS